MGGKGDKVKMIPADSLDPEDEVKQQSREKLFFLAGHHSRNSSTSSSEPDLKEEKVEEKKRCHVTGGCLCKISLLVYLAVCILVSALYVGIYGQNQQPFGEVWIPGKVGGHTHLVLQARPTSTKEEKSLVNCIYKLCLTGMQLAG